MSQIGIAAHELGHDIDLTSRGAPRRVIDSALPVLGVGGASVAAMRGRPWLAAAAALLGQLPRLNQERRASELGAAALDRMELPPEQVARVRDDLNKALATYGVGAAGAAAAYPTAHHVLKRYGGNSGRLAAAALGLLGTAASKALVDGVGDETVDTDQLLRLREAIGSNAAMLRPQVGGATGAFYIPPEAMQSRLRGRLTERAMSQYMPEAEAKALREELASERRGLAVIPGRPSDRHSKISEFVKTASALRALTF